MAWLIGGLILIDKGLSDVLKMDEKFWVVGCWAVGAVVVTDLQVVVVVVIVAKAEIVVVGIVAGVEVVVVGVVEKDLETKSAVFARCDVVCLAAEVATGVALRVPPSSFSLLNSFSKNMIVSCILSITD